MASTFKAGDKVKKSGIYSVIHDREHADAHDVTCVAGRMFPPCCECGQGVRFHLVRHAKHVGHHEQFKP